MKSGWICGHCGKLNHGGSTCQCIQLNYKYSFIKPVTIPPWKPDITTSNKKDILHIVDPRTRIPVVLPQRPPEDSKNIILKIPSEMKNDVKLDDKSELTPCPICIDHQIRFVCGCGHAYCATCIDRMIKSQKCDICNKKIIFVMKLFI